MEGNFNKLKDFILKQVVERSMEFKIDLLKFEEGEFRRRIDMAFKSILRENRISLKPSEQQEVRNEIMSYFLGLGPIDKLLKDPDVSEIMINGPRQVYVEKKGNIELTDIFFRDDEHLLYFVERILSSMGRQLTELEPYIDARLNDGSRVNLVKSPVSSNLILFRSKVFFGVDFQILKSFLLTDSAGKSDFTNFHACT